MHAEVWEGWILHANLSLIQTRRRTSWRMNRRSSVSIILLASGLGSGSCRLANCSKNDARQEVRTHFLSGVISAVAMAVLASSQGDHLARVSFNRQALTSDMSP